MRRVPSHLSPADVVRALERLREVQDNLQRALRYAALARLAAAATLTLARHRSVRARNSVDLVSSAGALAARGARTQQQPLGDVTLPPAPTASLTVRLKGAAVGMEPPSIPGAVLEET